MLICSTSCGRSVTWCHTSSTIYIVIETHRCIALIFEDVHNQHVKQPQDISGDHFAYVQLTASINQLFKYPSNGFRALICFHMLKHFLSKQEVKSDGVLKCLLMTDLHGSQQREIHHTPPTNLNKLGSSLNYGEQQKVFFQLQRISHCHLHTCFLTSTRTISWKTRCHVFGVMAYI